MPPVAPANFLIVKMDKAFQDEIVFESGVKLFKPTDNEPEWHVSVTGTVISVPNRIQKKVDGYEKPEYKGLKQDVKVGDTVIFSYMVCFDMDLKERDTPVHANLFYHNGEWFWKVDYQFVLGYIRDGVLSAATGYVFLEAVEDGTEKIGLIWMPESTVKEKAKDKARVLAVGENKEHEPKLSIREGDIVYYPERFGQKYEINNRKYIVLNQNYLVGAEK